MKKIILFTTLTISAITLFAADYLFIHHKDNNVTSVDRSTVDSIKFTSNQTELTVYNNTPSTSIYALSNIDSITFSSITDETIKIIYNETNVSIINPFANKGVSITASGADVTVNSTLLDKELTYNVSGTSSDGSLKIYSNYKYTLALNGATITNANGPAINIQSTKKCTLDLISGTTNTLTDATTYATSTEDQKSTLFSEGQLIIKGTGTLNVSSKSKHAICSDDYIEIEGGIINITSAIKDGIHTNDHFNLEGGTVTVTATGDAVECEAGNIKISGGSISSTIATADTKGLKSDSTLLVSGGTINFTVSGNQAKGLKAGKNMTLSGGNINISTSGAAVLVASGSGFDPSYCTAIKCDSSLLISGATINITTSGVGNKAISADKNIYITSGTLKITGTGAGATYTNSLGLIDAYSSSGIDADGNVNILGGNISVTESGSAAKGISTDGNLNIGNATNSPIIYVKNAGTKLLISGTANYASAVYSEPKNIKSDGIMTIANGTIGLNATQPGANTIDCDSILNVTGGVINDTISGNQSKGLKSSKAMTLSGGNINIKASGAVVLEYTTSTTLYDPSYCAAIKSDTEVNLSGANVNIYHTGAGGKGISADTNINMTSGTVNITTTGGGAKYLYATGAYDSYSATAFSADGNISVLGGNLTTNSSGTGGKGLKANGTLTIGSTTQSPTVSLTTSGTTFTVSGSDLCHPKTIVTDGAIIIANGTNTISSTDDAIHSETSITVSGGNNTVTKSTEGIESKYIYITGGENNITASNDGLNGTMGTVSGGTESNDNSLISISGGTTYVTGADAIDANGNFVMTGGIVFSNGPASGAEEFIDANGTAKINGGVFVGCSSAGMLKTSTFSSSTQPFLYITTTLSTSTMFTVTAGGNWVASFKPKNGGGVCLVSAPQMTKGGAYVVYTGGTYTGGTAINNFYMNGTFSNTGATTKKSSTLSTTATLNSISF